MPRQNREKESPELFSDSEVWLAIRYLDPDLSPKRSQNTAYIALIMVVVLVGLIWYSLYLRGL